MSLIVYRSNPSNIDILKKSPSLQVLLGAGSSSVVIRGGVAGVVSVTASTAGGCGGRTGTLGLSSLLLSTPMFDSSKSFVVPNSVLPTPSQVQLVPSTAPFWNELAMAIPGWSKTVQNKSVFLKKSKILGAFKKMMTRLNSRDKGGVESYTSSWYFSMNSLQRDIADGVSTFERDYGVPVTHIEDKIRSTTKALCKLIRTEQGKSSLSSFTFSKAPQTVFRVTSGLPSCIVDSIMEGGTYQDPGFLSTSLSKGIFKAEDGTVTELFVIESFTGVNVKQFSRYAKEDEILYRPKTMFKVTKVVKEYYDSIYGKVTLIMMRELY